MAIEVVLAAFAIDDLDAIYAYVAAKGGDDVADAYIACIEARCRATGEAPLTGTPRDDLAPGVRTIPFERRATIAYRVGDRTVTILAVAHAGRDLSALLGDRV